MTAQELAEKIDRECVGTVAGDFNVDKCAKLLEAYAAELEVEWLKVSARGRIEAARDRDFEWWQQLIAIDVVPATPEAGRKHILDMQAMACEEAAHAMQVRAAECCTNEHGVFLNSRLIKDRILALDSDTFLPE
jgi:hypothetical protein